MNDVVDEALSLMLFAICDAEQTPTEDELANAVIGIMQLKKWKDEYERGRISRDGIGHDTGLD